MAKLNRMKKPIIRFFARLAPRLLRRRRFADVRVVERVSDVPDETGNLIYLVERGGNLRWAILDCPCRQGHLLSVDLNPTHDPHWTVRREDLAVSLYPSLWYRDQCRSHFLITRNMVKWVQ
jgi:hypothetical protein